MNKQINRRYTFGLFITLIIITLAGCSINRQSTEIEEKLPIIYSPEYNISILGIENFHPFDTKKYKRVAKHLTKNCGINKRDFIKPHYVTNEELLLVHTPEYLESLNSSKTISHIAEIHPLRMLPNFVLRNGMLKPMKYATGGTILGAQLALEKGWAINLSGGYHHAKSSNGEGFCVYSDVPIALKKIWQKNESLRVAIIDLDAHQGNGFSMILGNDDRVAILDIYNSRNYPDDKPAEELLSHDVPIEQRTDTEPYLQLVRDWTDKLIDEHNPELIVYNAGTDIYEHDPLGRLNVSKEGIIERDEIVFTKAIENKIPILMVLSGGYHIHSGEIIGESIENLLKNVIQ